MAFMSFQPYAKMLILKKEINLSSDTFKCFLAKQNDYLATTVGGSTGRYYKSWNHLYPGQVLCYGSFASPFDLDISAHAVSVANGYTGPKTVTWTMTQNDSLGRAEVQMSPVSWSATGTWSGLVTTAFVYDDTHAKKVVVAAIALSTPGISYPNYFYYDINNIYESAEYSDSIVAGEAVTISGCKVYL